LKLAGELEPDCYPYEHAEARLLGDQRAHGAQPLVRILAVGRACDLLLVCLAEPAALLERLREDPLQAGRRVRDELLGMAEALGVRAQRLHCGVDLLGGVPILRHHPIISFMTMRLTELSHGAGCGCKLSAADLAPILAGLPAPTDPRVLVAAATADDAAVVQLTDEIAIVQTADFFTPIVDDPYLFGRIAATNALSDIYAMGATPVSALNLVAFPLETLGPDVLREILRGGAEAVAAAGASIVGGHSIDDPEPKYGLAVTGVVHPREVITNAGGRPGNALVLTKPLGAGIVSTAVKRGIGAPLDEAIEVMTTLNAEAATAARRAGAQALTDVTGFGLLGHLHELALASGCAAEVLAEEVPAIEGVLELTQVAIAGGTRRNREHAESFATFGYGVPEERRWLLCDAMTSGGLLAAVPQKMDQGWTVGRLVEGEPGTITIA
jgi:selenide, water dikinase